MKTTVFTIFAIIVSTSICFAEPSEKGGQKKDDPAGGAQIRQFVPPPGVGQLGMRKMVNADGVTTVVNEDGREITITENDDGISVSIAEPGAEAKEYTSKDADTLQQEHPEAHELYNRYCKDLDHGGGVRIMGLDGKAMIGPMNKKIEPLGVRCMNVADPFVKKQLGDGVSVAKVYPDTRATALGLQQYDYIRAINGKPTETAEDIVKLLEEVGDAKLSIEITRGGEKMTISE
jgi:S1-C subfamily serine protease